MEINTNPRDRSKLKLVELPDPDWLRKLREKRLAEAEERAAPAKRNPVPADAPETTK